MNITKLLKKIPYIDKKIRAIKPNIEDVLYEFYNSKDKINFLDIGANTGQTIEFIERIFNNAIIYSFEPTKNLYDDLVKKYNSRENINLYNIALADTDKQLDFYQSEFSPTNSCLEPNTSLYKEFSHGITKTLEESIKIKVEGKKLDTWFNKNISNEVIDIIKIDTQGFEYDVIKGGINTLKDSTKLVYFEIQYHDFYKNSKPFYKIFELLYENGFYYYCHLASNKRKKFQVLESDVLFVNKTYFKPHN